MIKLKLCSLLAKSCDDYEVEQPYDVLHANFFNISFHHNEKIITGGGLYKHNIKY